MAYYDTTQSCETIAHPNIRSELFYDDAEVLVCDPVASSRAATRSSLYSLGCRHIELCANLRDFLEGLENRPPDIALCEIHVGETELCHAIRDIRQGRSYNPFAIIIITAWKPSAGLVNQILATGADGVLLRPFSTAILDQRIRTHVLQQKPFVVTDHYIGPERRSSERQSNTRSISRPNSLRAKLEAPEHSDTAVNRFNVELRHACVELMSAKLRTKVLELRD